jgi:nicotinamidase/pyrazinamidase
MKRVLLVIDMLNDFCNEKGSLYSPECAKIIPNVDKLIKEFIDNNERVVFITDWHKENDKEFNLFPKHCVEETWGAEIVEDFTKSLQGNFPGPFKHLGNSHAMRIRKYTYSPFYDNFTDVIFNNAYELLGIPNKADFDNTEFWVTGVCTNICIHYTVEELHNRNFNVVIPVNCVASFDVAEHEHSLKVFQSLFGFKCNEDNTLLIRKRLYEIKS